MSFTGNLDSTSGTKAVINITSNVAIDYSKSYYLLDTSNVKATNENAWNQLVSSAVAQGNITENGYTVSAITTAPMFYVHVKLVDVNGNVYYYVNTFKLGWEAGGAD